MKRRLLLIVDRCGPGDALRIRPLVEACANEPETQVLLVCSEQAAPVLESVPGLNRVVISRLYGRRQGTGAWAQLRKSTETLRLLVAVGRSWDQAVVFLWGSFYLRLLGRLAARKVAGYAGTPAFLLTSRLGPYSAQPDFDQNVALLREAEIEWRPDRLVKPANAAVTSVRSLLAEAGPGPEGPLVVLHPGSDWACQQWRPQRWAALIDELWSRYRARIVITGTTAEAAHASAICAAASSQVVSLVGRTSVAELEAVISIAALCICVDSLAYELAQSVGTPTVVLAGPTPTWIAPGTIAPPTIVNSTPEPQRQQINACQGRHSRGHCQDWDCPFAGLPMISPERALRAIETIGALRPIPRRQAASSG